MTDSKKAPELLQGDQTEGSNANANNEAIKPRRYCRTLDPSRQRDIAEAWIKANPRLWQAVKGIAADCVAGKRHFSVQRAMAMIRYQGVKGIDPAFKVNNTSLPAMSRLLLIEMPECKTFLELRQSKCAAEFPELEGVS